MTARRSHSKAVMESAAALAVNLSVTVRLEPDGSLVISPPYLDRSPRRGEPETVEEWRRRKNGGETRGHS